MVCFGYNLSIYKKLKAPKHRIEQVLLEYVLYGERVHHHLVIPPTDLKLATPQVTISTPLSSSAPVASLAFGQFPRSIFLLFHFFMCFPHGFASTT